MSETSDSGPGLRWETHEQGMACLTCGLAGFTPEHAFPQEPGPWDRPCPSCGEATVWVTEVRPRRQSEGEEE